MSTGLHRTHPLQPSFWTRRAKWLAMSVIPMAMVACGGGSAPDGASSGPVSADTVVLDMQGSALSVDVANQAVVPAFHLAPVVPEAPSDMDAADSAASAKMAPRATAIPPEMADLSTKRLTLQDIRDVQQARAASLDAAKTGPALAPLAGTAAVVTYTPAQIRAAYGLPALPAAGAALTSAQAAQMGAGQTIYIIDAMHNPNVVAELSAFNQKFGLPACTVKAVATNAALPLAAPSASACELSVVYATAAGGMTAAAPAYNAGWATEIAMDVQWSHATAPLARIVLIEVPDATLNSFLGGIKLANAMGPGVVSMSFGAAEGSWTASVDALFTAPKMTYIASSGDSGMGVNWPAVSPNVLAVGGTSLTYTGSTARSEISWSGSGGGTSAFVSASSYQNNAVPGMGTVTRRTVPDVAFNADPATGQYVAVIKPGTTTVGWASAGGTSISAPQWAGVVAVTNAIRATGAKTAIGAPHSALYAQLASVPGTYASTFADIVNGSNGLCASCAAKVGYDAVTGLGTPHAAPLISALTGLTTTVAPPVASPSPSAPAPTTSTVKGPVITAPAMVGVAGKPLSSPITIKDASAAYFSVSISGVPLGMGFSVSGQTITAVWPSPVLGTYSLKISVVDSAGYSAQVTVPITITAK